MAEVGQESPEGDRQLPERSGHGLNRSRFVRQTLSVCYTGDVWTRTRRTFSKPWIYRLVTKDDVRDIIKEEVPAIVRAMIVEVVPGIVAVKIKPVREQLKQIEKRLELLEQNYANLKGVTKEIDEIRAEVRAIQKHLGIERKIAA